MASDREWVGLWERHMIDDYFWYNCAKIGTHKTR